MLNAVCEMQQLLFHIHGLSDLVFSHHRELIDSGKLRNDPDAISEPLLSISEIIQEKAEACLEKLELLEVHFREAEKAAEAEPLPVQ